MAEEKFTPEQIQEFAKLISEVMRVAATITTGEVHPCNGFCDYMRSQPKCQEGPLANSIQLCYRPETQFVQAMLPRHYWTWLDEHPESQEMLNRLCSYVIMEYVGDAIAKEVVGVIRPLLAANFEPEKAMAIAEARVMAPLFAGTRQRLNKEQKQPN